MAQITIEISAAQAAFLELERKAFNDRLAVMKPPGDEKEEVATPEFAQMVWDQACNEKVADHNRRERLRVANTWGTADQAVQQQVKTLLKL